MAARTAPSASSTQRWRNREGAEQPPRAAPEREDDGGGGDAQPGDAEHADVREQQDRERGTQVMEDGAGEEI